MKASAITQLRESTQQTLVRESHCRNNMREIKEKDRIQKIEQYLDLSYDILQCVCVTRDISYVEMYIF